MYIVIELQTNETGQTANIVSTHDTLPEAQQKYYGILSAAAVSAVPIHSACILDNTGMGVAQYSFRHEK